MTSHQLKRSLFSSNDLNLTCFHDHFLRVSIYSSSIHRVQWFSSRVPLSNNFIVMSVSKKSISTAPACRRSQYVGWSVSYQTRNNNTRQIYVGLGLRLGLWLWLGLWVTDMLCNCWVYEASRSSNSDVFSCRLYVSIAADVRKPALSRFLANVNSCSCSLYVVVRPSVCHLSSVCLSSVCNVRAPYSADWNFRQCFCAV